MRWEKGINDWKETEGRERERKEEYWRGMGRTDGQYGGGMNR